MIFSEVRILHTVNGLDALIRLLYAMKTVMNESKEEIK